jgi:hypothetical protein
MVQLNHPAQGNTNWFTPVDQNWTTLEQSLDQAICEGRLSLSGSVALPMTDVTAATTLYYIPYKGDRISLYTGSTWQINSIPSAGSGATSLSLSGLTASTNYDIFLYNNSGTLTLDKLIWTSVTASNNPAAGSNVTINVSNTSGVVVGSLVTLLNSARNSTTGLFNIETARVNAVSANTSITVDTLINSYTTPTVTYRMASQDGILVKPGDSTRRYLGTIRITSTAGQCEDSQVRRFVSNYYNRVPRSLFVCPDYSSSVSNTYTTASTTYVQCNGGTNATVEFVSTGEDATQYLMQLNGQNSMASQWRIGVGEDSTSGPTSGAQTLGSGHSAPACGRTAIFTAGYHYLTMLINNGGSGTVTVNANQPADGGPLNPYGSCLSALVMG